MLEIEIKAVLANPWSMKKLLEKLGEDKEVIEQELLALARKLGVRAFEPRTYLAMVLSK